MQKRRAIRLREYDYSQAGMYFVTLCVQGRACLFGDIADGRMVLNEAGRMIRRIWDEIPENYPGVEIDARTVMPNHVHGIIVLVGAAPCGRPRAGRALSLPDVAQRYKTMTTKLYADGVRRSNWPPFNGRLWQRSYYERVIRNDEELNAVREYILTNPIRWELDRENPDVDRK